MTRADLLEVVAKFYPKDEAERLLREIEPGVFEITCEFTNRNTRDVLAGKIRGATTDDLAFVFDRHNVKFESRENSMIIRLAEN